MTEQNNQNSRRGRARGRGNPRNYADPARIAQSEAEQDKIKKNLDDNERRAQNAPKPKVDVHKIVQEGKAVLNKFFTGFESKDRSNVTVELDENFPLRIAEIYKDRISSEARQSTEYLNDNTLPTQHVRKFRSGLDAAIAIKLYRSSPLFEQGMNDQMSYLKSGKANLPEKVSVIINQIGKTDLPNNNKLRVSEQGFLAKRFMVRSIYQYLGRDSFYNECDKANANGMTAVHLETFVRDNFNLMIDTSRNGLYALKQLGKEYFLKQAKENIPVKILAGATAANQDINFRMKLPNFEFKQDGSTIADVVNYLANPIFDRQIFELPNLATWINVVCSLTFQCATLSWLRQPNRTMAQIDNNFANTVIANVTFQGLMVASGIWSINSFIDDKDLNDLFGEVLKNWNSVMVPIYRNYLRFKEVSFSEFGSEAQLIEVTPEYKAVTGNVFNYFRIKGKPKVESTLHTSETAAVFGAMVKFVKNVRFTSDFKVNINSDSNNILNEFLKADFN